MCQALIDQGETQFSMLTILHSIRYQIAVDTTGEFVPVDGGETLLVKINNNHAAYYARLWLRDHPQHPNFFKLRRAEGDIERPPEVGLLERFLRGRRR
jgi:hypothetical protein